MTVGDGIAGGAKLTLHRLEEEMNQLPPHSVKKLELYKAKSHLMDSIRIIERELKDDVRNP